MAPLHRHLPFLLLAGLSLVPAVLGGLARLFWDVPLPHMNWLSFHGPLMVSGFFGTLIGLERAAALRHPVAYLVPLGLGVGGALLVFGQLGSLPRWTAFAGSLGFVGLFVPILRRRTSTATLLMTGGAAALATGNGCWLAGWPVADLVPWWAAFLIWTIVGERFELTRFHSRSRWRWPLLFASVGLHGAGLALHPFRPEIGDRLLGAGLIGFVLLLFVCDIARKNLRKSGVTRFVAVSLLSGYAWLLVAGLWHLIGAPIAAGGLQYDAALHATFVGFVFSMVFGHAPIVFPALLGRSLPFTRLAYLPLLLLHGTLLLRLGGDLLGSHPARQWGGMGNAVALLVFVLATIHSALKGRAEASA